WRCSMLTQR
ncbi:exodeoxyribonuclease V, gamma subunit, partial [Vibrio parahaemolyticus V-223/04]